MCLRLVDDIQVSIHQATPALVRHSEYLSGSTLIIRQILLQRQFKQPQSLTKNLPVLRLTITPRQVGIVTFSPTISRVDSWNFQISSLVIKPYRTIGEENVHVTAALVTERRCNHSRRS
jgi:hypothetical protein